MAVRARPWNPPITDKNQDNPYQSEEGRRALRASRRACGFSLLPGFFWPFPKLRIPETVKGTQESVPGRVEGLRLPTEAAQALHQQRPSWLLVPGTTSVYRFRSG